jgi:hypothetical protein
MMTPQRPAGEPRAAAPALQIIGTPPLSAQSAQKTFLLLVEFLVGQQPGGANFAEFA